MTVGIAIFLVCVAGVAALLIASRISERRDRGLGITRCIGCDAVVHEPGFCSPACHEDYFHDTST